VVHATADERCKLAANSERDCFLKALRDKCLNRWTLCVRVNPRAEALQSVSRKLGSACRADRQELFDAIGKEAKNKGFVGTLLFVARKLQVVGLLLAIAQTF